MSAARRHARLAVTVAALATMAAGVTLAVLPHSQEHHPAGGILPPGSMGSLPSHHAWWDPRGWLDSHTGPPKPHQITVTSPRRRTPAPHRTAAPRRAMTTKPRRMRELAGRRTANSRVYRLSDGRLQADISAAPVSYADPRGRWQPIDTTVRPSTRPRYRYANTSNTLISTARGTTTAVLVLGFVGGCVLGGLADAYTGAKSRSALAFTVIATILGLTALTAAIVGLITDGTVALAVLVAATLALWLVATTRHAFIAAAEPAREREAHEIRYPKEMASR